MTNPPTLETIRARAKEHEREMEAVRWLTPQQLGTRWGVSVGTVYAIPRDELPYMTPGRGRKFARRRYHPDAIAAYEASGKLQRQGAA